MMSSKHKPYRHDTRKSENINILVNSQESMPSTITPTLQFSKDSLPSWIDDPQLCLTPEKTCKLYTIL